VGRLDNLAMSFCSLTALLDTYPTAEALADEPAVKAVALFDNEEVGSDSAQGEDLWRPSGWPLALDIAADPPAMCSFRASDHSVTSLGPPSAQ